MQGKGYETLNLVDYRINTYGQTLPGDQFETVLQKIKEADVLVIGSPLYWHNICGSLRDLLDRCYGPLEESCLDGKLFFLFQDASPEKWMLEAVYYISLWQALWVRLCGNGGKYERSK